MSSLSILFLLALSGGPSPAEVAGDLDAHPWRPVPAAPMTAESTARIGSVTPPLATTPAAKMSKDPARAGSWQLQLGALANPDAANSEKKRLEKILGVGTVEIVSDGGVGKLRYGRFGSKEEAETARTGLKAKGIDGFATLRP